MDIVSTYRLQFHQGFTFLDAVAIIPYLHDLGITHVYASPYLKAVAGSTHGYDVIDHNQFNPEIGSAQDFKVFVKTLSDHGMSHILDTVPNHMGVGTNDNRWWNDVLAKGNNSEFANYFDIDWEGVTSRRELAGKVLLPVLGEPFSQALVENKLQLKWEDGKLFVCYQDRLFPIDSESRTDVGLDQLLAGQHYRLSSWRVAADEINYRRFFDITGLAALQMHRLEVFDAAHAFTLSLIADGSVAGLRVDHPDGLLDPEQYFHRLQAAAGKPLFVSVEKILNGDETLCESWPVSGTSGYDFLGAINDLFVDSANESAMTEIYTQFTGNSIRSADWIYLNKCQVLDTAMYSEMSALTNRLDALAQAEISSRDFTRRQLHDALREIIACFGVYRSYISTRGISDTDIAEMNRAAMGAVARNPKVDAAAVDYIRDSVLLRYPVAQSTRGRQLDFAQRFQQLTAPVNAKGIEDSTFYIYNRLTSLNEVGGDLGRFGRDSQAIHRYLAHRQQRWPLSLSSLSTHDTKRSEDVRARLNVLSEMPDEWNRHVNLWREVNASLGGTVDTNDQYLLYQTLLGAWPLHELDDQTRQQLVKRICAYMQKAAREAKVHTSWVDPDERYESALSGMIEKIFDPRNVAFLSDFLPFQKKINHLGSLNSLSQTVLRLCSPGICDTYQGTELWDFSLVDPDNRRPVDYSARQEILRELKSGRRNDLKGLTDDFRDGRIKLWCNFRLLNYRRQRPELFLKGTYEPIMAIGKQRSHVFGFFRRWQNQILIVIVPRLFVSLLGDGPWQHADWSDTKIAIPQGAIAKRFENVLTGITVIPAPENELWLAELMKDFPGAVLSATM